MNNHASLVIASILGLVAGMSHSIVSHYQKLSFSWSEQVVEFIQGNSFNISDKEIEKL